MRTSRQPANYQPDPPPSGDVSKLLRAWSAGDQSALEKLVPIVYAEVHLLARRYMKRERPGHSLQTTALVNEAYMRLVDYKSMQWRDRAHFFAVSAQLMRRILVEHARRHNLKRGGRVPHLSLDEAAEVVLFRREFPRTVHRSFLLRPSGDRSRIYTLWEWRNERLTRSKEPPQFSTHTGLPTALPSIRRCSAKCRSRAEFIGDPRS